MQATKGWKIHCQTLDNETHVAYKEVEFNKPNNLVLEVWTKGRPLVLAHESVKRNFSLLQNIRW